MTFGRSLAYVERQSCLPTAGDIGIGKATGVQLAKNGSKVALASRNPAHLESVRLQN